MRNTTEASSESQTHALRLESLLRSIIETLDVQSMLGGNTTMSAACRALPLESHKDDRQVVLKASCRKAGHVASRKRS